MRGSTVHIHTLDNLALPVNPRACFTENKPRICPTHTVILTQHQTGELWGANTTCFASMTPSKTNSISRLSATTFSFLILVNTPDLMQIWTCTHLHFSQLIILSLPVFILHCSVKLWASAFGGEMKSIAAKYSGSQLLQKVHKQLIHNINPEKVATKSTGIQIE